MRIVIDDNCLNRQGGTGGVSYDDTAILKRLQKLESRTDNFVKDVTVSREGNKVKFTYTRVDGTKSEAEFDDNDKQTLSLDGRTLSISNGNSVTLPTSGGSMSSAISAYSGSYTSSGWDELAKGITIHANDLTTVLVPEASSGNLQLLNTQKGIWLRTRSDGGDAVVIPLTHVNENPKFNSAETYPRYTNMYISLDIGPSKYIVNTNVYVGENPTIPFTAEVSEGAYFDKISLLFDSSPQRIALTVYKGLHVYTMVSPFAIEEETTEADVNFNFPAYADFGLDEKHAKITLHLSC